MGDKVKDTEEKWNDICQGLHHSFLVYGEVPYRSGPEAFSGGVSFPSIADKGSTSKPSNHTDITQCLSIRENSTPVGVGNVSLTMPSSSLPVLSVENNPSGLQMHVLNNKQPETICLRPRLFPRSDLDMPSNLTSTSSVTSVSTDLTLGTVHAPPYKYKEGRHTPRTNLIGSDAVPRCPFQRSSVTENVKMIPTQSSMCSSYSESAVITINVGKEKSSKPLIKDTTFSLSENRDSSSSSIPNTIDLRDFKTLFRSLLEKVGWQEEALCSVAETIMRCTTGNGRCRGMWLALLGPDRKGKKRIAAALSELLFGSRNKLIHADLDSHDDNRSSNMICNEQGISGCNEIFRGKMAVDHIAGEIRSKPFSVVLLENVDKADLLVQCSLSQAIQTGRFCDSHGREINVRNTVFITTARNGKESNLSPAKNHCNFSEEKILAAQKWRMKLLIKLLYKSVDLNSGSSDPFIGESNDGTCSPCFVRANKRKLECSNEGNAWCKLDGTDERPQKIVNTALDLNLPFDSATEDAESSNECDRASSQSADSWLEEFSGLVDGAINFKPFDFDVLASNVTKEINKCLRNSISSNCLLEIEPKAMEQMLAATWSSDGIGALNNWLQLVLTKSFLDADEKYNLSHQTVLRLVACEDLYMEDQAPGICLPSRILVE